MPSRDRRVYILAGIMLGLVPVAFVLPRWLTPADAGFAGGAVAASIFLLGLAGVVAAAMILFLYSWSNRKTLSKAARIVGLAPFPVIGTVFLLLLMKLVF